MKEKIKISFNKELYSKIALIKAAYNYLDVAYVHLDADNTYYYVEIEKKNDESKITEQGFINEMLAQSVRHEIYCQTKSIRELMLARTMASSIIIDEENTECLDDIDRKYDENEILKDWFVANEEVEN